MKSTEKNNSKNYWKKKKTMVLSFDRETVTSLRVLIEHNTLANLSNEPGERERERVDDV